MNRIVKLIIALFIVLLALFMLSGIDGQKPVKPIEKPVNIDAPVQ